MNISRARLIAGFYVLFHCASWTVVAAEHTNPVTAVHIPNSKAVIKALMDNDGVIHVLFDAADEPRYTKSTDGGATFSKPMSIVDAASRKPGLQFHAADMAVGKRGRVHVAMSNNAWKLKLPEEEWSLYYATLGPGAAAFSPVRNLNRKPSEGFSLAADDKGNVTACFLSGKLFVMASNDDGEHFFPATEIDAAWDPCNCCTTSAAYGSGGRVAIIYREETNNDRDMYVILWDQTGATKPVRHRISGEPWQVSGCPMTYFTITPAGTGYLAAWPTKGKVYFSRLDKEGRAVPQGEIRAPGSAGMRTGLLAVGGPDDDTTLVAWKNDQVLGWQLYDRNGKPQGKASSTPSPGNGAAAAALQNNTFLVFP